ncbi:MAG TPA: hypothetical protein VGD50_04860, partial [Candidatus Baltobacteraceae bacterium]
NGQNDPRYCNKAVSESIAEGQLLYDLSARHALLNFQQEQIVKDVPVIVLDSRREIFAYNDDLKNFNPGFSNAPFENMMNVDI